MNEKKMFEKRQELHKQLLKVDDWCDDAVIEYHKLWTWHNFLLSNAGSADPDSERTIFLIKEYHLGYDKIVGVFVSRPDAEDTVERLNSQTKRFFGGMLGANPLVQPKYSVEEFIEGKVKL